MWTVRSWRVVGGVDEDMVGEAGGLKILVEPCVVVVRRVEGSRWMVRAMWSPDTRPPP